MTHISDIHHLYNCFLEVDQFIATDTRKELKGSLFFCLSGDRFDGNMYAQQALDSGAKYVVSNNSDIVDPRILFFENPNETLGTLALHHSKNISCKLIAIGGSNGKTTTKELVYQVLKLKYQVKATKGNFNNHIGVPLTILDLTNTTDIGIIELGTNHPGEMAYLCNLFQIDSAIITNIGKEHLEGFNDIEAVAKEESELYAMAIRDGAMAFVNADDPWLNNMSKRLTRKKTFSLNDHTADVYLRISEEMPELVFDIYANYKLIGNTRSNLGGLFNGYNIAAAITVGLHYEVSITEIIQGISQYVSTMNRSQWIHTKDDQHILLDAYNANPSSMNAGIESFSKIKESKALFLGDMLELGKHAIIEHQAIYDKAVSLGYEEIFLVGKHFKEALPQYPFVFDHTAALLAWLDLHPIKARYIYIKGSRGIAMEQCLDYFNL